MKYSCWLVLFTFCSFSPLLAEESKPQQTPQKTSSADCKCEELGDEISSAREVLFIGRVIAPHGKVTGWGHEGTRFQVLHFLKRPKSVEVLVRQPIKKSTCERLKDYKDKECKPLGNGQYDCSDSEMRKKYLKNCQNITKSEKFPSNEVVVDSLSLSKECAVNFEIHSLYWVRAKRYNLGNLWSGLQSGDLNERWWTYQCHGTRKLEGELEMADLVEEYHAKKQAEILEQIGLMSQGQNGQ